MSESSRTKRSVRITLELEITSDRPMPDEMLLWAAANIYLRAGETQEQKIHDYGKVTIRKVSRTGAVLI